MKSSISIRYKKYLEWNYTYSQSTIQTYLNLLAMYLFWLEKEGLQVKEVEYNDLLLYVEKLREVGNKGSTISQKVRVVKLLYLMLKNEGVLQVDPSKDLVLKQKRLQPVINYLSEEKLRVLYQNYDTANLVGKRNKEMLGVLVFCGLSSGEVASILVRDIDLDGGMLFVKGSRKRSERYVPLSPYQLLGLQRYMLLVRPELLKQRGCESQQLFLSIGSGSKLWNALRYLLLKLKKMNKEVESFKQLRASVMSNWLKHKGLREVQYLSGHRYLSSTDRYNSQNIEGLQKKIDAHHPLG